MTDQPTTSSELILYQTEDGQTRIQCRFEGETLWLTQALIAELFQKDVRGCLRLPRQGPHGPTGARWSLVGAEAVPRLRALRASGDFDEYWAFHLDQDRARNHAARYADAQIPDPIPVRKHHLRRIK